MRSFHRVAVALSLCVAASCVGPTNPLDPETPADRQSPAVVFGVVVDDGGVAVEGAVVVVTDAAAAREDTTDADGAFRVEGLVPGVADLAVSHPAHFAFARDLLLTAAEDRELSVVLQPVADGGEGTGHISGVARKGAQTNQEAALQDHSGVTVEIAAAGVRTVTNAAGAFDIFILPGTYTIAFSAGDHLPTTTANVEVVAGETITLDAITLPINPGGASGTALLEGREDDDTAHAGTIVSQVNGSATTTTGADGSWVLPDLPPGVVTLRFVAASDHDVVEKIISVQAGRQAVVDAVIVPRSRGSIAGTIDLLGRSDDGGALVSLSGDALFALSSSEGAFLITGVPTGTREITASADGFSRGVRGGITVEANRTVNIGTLALTAGGGDFLINDGDAFANDADVTLDIDSDDAVQMRVSEDPTFGDVAVPEAFAAQATFSLSDGDGEKTIFIELIDAGGVVIDLLSASIVLDTSPPEQTSVSINNGAGFSNNPDGLVTLSINAVDNTSGVDRMQVSFDGDFDEPFEAFVAQKVVGLVPNTDGVRGVFVRFVDRAGNVTAAVDAAVDDITLDRIAPVATISLNGGNALATSPFASLDIALDANSRDTTLMAIATDENVATPIFQAFAASSTVLLLPGEGQRSIGVKLQDAAGNISDAFTDSVVVDQTAPAGVTLLLDGGAAFTTDRTVTVGISSDDATAQVRVSVDGVFDGSAAAENFSPTPPATVTLPAGNGPKRVIAQLRDAAGNLSAVATASITLDDTPPTLGATPVVINAGDDFTRSVSVTVAFDVQDAVEAAIAVDGTVDTEAFAPFAATAVALLPAGDCADRDCKSVCARFRDAAGNTTAQRCDTITLDTTPPSAPILEEGDVVLANDAFTFHLAGVPDDTFLSHVEVLVEPRQPVFERLDTSTPAATVSIPFVIDPADLVTPAEAGVVASRNAVTTHRLRVRAVDLAGNVSPENTIVVRIDDVAPELPLLAGLPNPPEEPFAPQCQRSSQLNADTVQVNFQQPGVAAGDATFSHYEINGPLLSEPIETNTLDGIIFTLVPNQLNILSIVAVDEAGLRSPPAIACVREDSEPPSQPLIVPGDGVVRADQVDVFLAIAAEDIVGVPPLPVAVAAYELKDGRGTGFERVDSATGPFTAVLSRQAATTEICLRGVDATNNPGIEDCVIVNNARSRQVLAPVDEARQHDIFGDFMVFFSGLDDQEVKIRDLRGALGDISVENPADPNDLQPASRLRMEGRGSDLRVVFDMGNDVAAFVRADLRQTDNPIVEAGTFVGRTPDVQGNHVVYVGADGTIRRRAPVVPPDFEPGGSLTPNPADEGTLISALGITVCEDTSPRVFDNAIVWCQVEGGNGVIKRRIVSQGGNPGGSPIETLSQNPVALRDEAPLGGGGGGGINQPVMSNLFIAWVEVRAGQNRLVAFPGPNRPFNVNQIIDPGVRIDVLNDMSGSTAVGVQRVGDLFNDVVAVDFLRPPVQARLVTDDPSPQSEPAIDGARLSFNDVAAGDRVLMADRTDTRWVSATTELEFEPITSTTQTVWLSLVDDEICLLARAVDDAVAGPVPVPVRIVDAGGDCDTPFFGGPTESDPAWSVGGDRVAYLVPTDPPSSRFLLRVTDVVTGARRDVSESASATMSLDPDGDAIAWVDATGTVFRATLDATLQGAPVNLGAPSGGAPIPHVDIDDGLVVIQSGGDPNERNDPGNVLCRDVSDSGFRAVTVPSGPGTINLVAKGPKVAKTVLGGVAGPTILGFIDTAQNAQACLAFSCAAGCSNVQPLGTGTGDDTNLRVARDGNVVNITSELGLRQAVLANVFTGTRTFLAAGVDISRQGLDVAVGRAVWGDFQLGDRDVWELTLR
jgi:hypothetical protein